jgi:superfamily II DNA helicase RecQ
MSIEVDMKVFITITICLALAGVGTAYDVVLKNGKTVHGSLISEDNEKISIKDKDGLVLNFKKSLIDLEKTSAANKPAAVAEPAKPAEQPQKESAEKSAPKTKKPARVYTDSDLYRLRAEHPMESGAGVEFEEGQPVSSGKGRSGEEWEQLTQQLFAEVKQAEQAYQQLSAKCKEFQGAAIQTHMAVTPEGKQVPLGEAKEQQCQAAEDAKGALEAAKQQYAAAVEQAKQDNVPPGYIATED